ncbi:MAG: sensor histidine kinase [Ferruginibacter sp.]|nr:sensor histidine kinase [Ferruginibacter sp.]
MRYVTEDAGVEKVALDKELDYLTNYIALQQIRSNDYLTVSFNTKGCTNDKVIAPLLLINYIENAFKHGVSNHIACFVNIDISVLQNELTMQVINKKFSENHTSGMSMGLNNTKRRLQLQYPKKHFFALDEKDDTYKVTLQLNLA